MMVAHMRNNTGHNIRDIGIILLR